MPCQYLVGKRQEVSLLLTAIAQGRYSQSGRLRQTVCMDKASHGPQLKAAMIRRGLSRTAVADYVGRKERTVTNWTTGSTMPDAAELELLEELLGPYRHEGDPVEVAVRASGLTEDRQLAVLHAYKRELREQDEAEERRRIHRGA